MAPLVELNETGILGHTRDNPKFVVLDSQPAEYHWAGLVTRYYKRNRPNLLIRVSRVYFFMFIFWPVAEKYGGRERLLDIQAPKTVLKRQDVATRV